MRKQSTCISILPRRGATQHGSTASRKRTTSALGAAGIPGARHRRNLYRVRIQILFHRVIADRHVNQCSTLKSRDELVVFDRIDGDATVAQAQHAVISRAVSGGGVPVWM